MRITLHIDSLHVQGLQAPDAGALEQAVRAALLHALAQQPALWRDWVGRHAGASRTLTAALPSPVTGPRLPAHDFAQALVQGLGAAAPRAAPATKEPR